ncbi:PAS domain S-box protein [Methanobacterium veterum]|uniref:histidine kinase n=1 Tax=Methanobacterium veterum TaxID=408577 RepID=A0A9E5A0I7_9EURY|nr:MULTISPECIES: PAS domain S-box protein [Methanobacterium]MCZ3364676.1 PAS domain S-box protein [Methanobacterium veterum]MCZ3372430.1 PAS domain S-box protein [Methanobacterium veterum]
MFLKSPIGILFYDKEGKLIAANQSAKEIAGIPESEDVSVNLFNNPDVVSRKEKLIGEGVIKFQSQINFEDMGEAGYYDPTRSGTAYLDFTISAVDSGYLVQIQDITERKKIEERLTENEKKYRELVENANSIILKMDKKGRITFFNEFAEKFFGFNKEKIMGKNVIGTIVPETESSGRNLRELINLIVSDPESHINMENENITHDKRRVWVSWTNKGIYDDEGNVTGVLSIGTDITKRKDAENAFKHLMFEASKSKNLILKELQEAHNNLELKVKKRTRELNESNHALRKEIQERKHAEEALIKSRNYLDKIINSIADPVFVKDKQHYWILLNDAYCKLMGYSREELLGKSDYDFFPSHEADVFWEKDEEVFKTGVENVNEEEFTDSEGNVHILVTKKTLYTDISGEKYIVASIKDITELKKTENNLRQSERKLTLAMDMAKLAYWEYDVSLDLFTFDDRFYKLYGTTADHEGGSKMSSEEYAQKFLPPEESHLVNEEMTKALKTDDPDFFGQVEHTIIRADGEKRFIIVRYGVIKNDEGRTIKTYGANQDITELKKAEAALKDSEAKFRGIFDNATDMISLIEGSKDGKYTRYIEVNNAGIKRLGYSKDEFLNMGPFDIDEGLETPENMKKLSKEGHVRFETVHVAKNGIKIPVEVIIHFINRNATDVALEISRDITERKKADYELKKSEQKYRTLFNSSPDSTILIRTDGNLMDVNHAAQEVTGVSKKDLIGKNFTELDLLLDEEMPLHIEKVSQVLRGKNLKPYESRFIDKNGKIHYVETYLKALKKDEEIFAFNVIAHDITERKKAEEKLRETIEELERSNYELQQFAYITSHDLQEPLRTIASFTQLLERRYSGQLDSDADEFIEFIVDAAVRMKEMIQGLLEYSRVGTQKVEFKEVDMNTELEQALFNLHALINKNKAEITHVHLPNVMADPAQIVRVFQNLISNAIKFRKSDEPPKIHVSCQIDKENNEYIFSVADNGIGIEKEYKDKIFEVFKRLHAMGKYEGTGIGLSVVKRIIEQYDGRIWVESELGMGSTFYFTLPFTHSKDI